MIRFITSRWFPYLCCCCPLFISLLLFLVKSPLQLPDSLTIGFQEYKKNTSTLYFVHFKHSVCVSFYDNTGTMQGAEYCTEITGLVTSLRWVRVWWLGLTHKHSWKYKENYNIIIILYKENRNALKYYRKKSMVLCLCFTAKIKKMWKQGKMDENVQGKHKFIDRPWCLSADNGVM